jgi:hypothetical protein
MLTKKRKELCESCGSEFLCDPQNIAACNCSKVALNSTERAYLKSKFKNCLCNTCLLLLKEKIPSLLESKSQQLPVRKLISIIFLVVYFQFLNSQTYAPAAGQTGSSAIHSDSSIFVNWVSACQVNRGYQDISDKSLGYASVGDSSMCLGKALSNGVLSLGDGGSVICTFNFPITNGTGFDFAVFENGITDTFLELAFVEVSSDGTHFFRFQSHSLTDSVNQTSGFGATDATKINNLAGKYRSGFGTPFDLQELAGINGLDVNSVTHIKITDVIGSLNSSYASRDAYGNKLNDPWPTPFPSGGFDLDAIGVIHENKTTSLNEKSIGDGLMVYPNPIQGGETVHLKSPEAITSLQVYNMQGKLMLDTDKFEFSTILLGRGMYVLKIETNHGLRVVKLLVN